MGKKADRLIKEMWVPAFLGAILLAPLLAKKIAPDLMDCLLRIPQEVALEKRIGKPLYFDLTGPGKGKKGRLKKLEEFEQFYDSMGNYWDNFYRQFSQAKKVYIHYPGPGEIHGSVDFSSGLTIYPYGEVVVHELAHLWHSKIIKENLEFNKKWSKISNNHYISDYEKASVEDSIKNGAVSFLALKNFKEDIAQTTTFVYFINHPEIGIKGFQNKNPEFRGEEKRAREYFSFIIIKESVPKIMRKLGLLREYDFFSEREYRHAIGELEGFLSEK